jgi:hypothetical protein
METVPGDANHLPLFSPCGTPSPGDVLTDHDDWGNLQYLPSESANWQDRASEQEIPFGSQELTYEQFQELSSLSFDCDGDSIPDDVEISAGTQEDMDGDGLPDDCEPVPTAVDFSQIPEAEGQNAEIASLRRVFPSPSAGAKRIEFWLAGRSEVRVAIFDVRGRRVRDLVRAVRGGGDHHVDWDGRDDAGLDLPGGIYFVRLEVGSFTRNQKVVHLGAR